MIRIPNWEKEVERNPVFAHFPETISKEIDDYVIDTVLKESRYIFVTRKAGLQRGYCTHCKNEYMTPNFKHKEFVNCLKCGSQCWVRSAGMSRKYLSNSFYFVYYEKSKINPEAIVARGFYVNRDYSGDFREVETYYGLSALYVFEPGTSLFFSNHGYGGSRYKINKAIYPLSSTTYQNYRCYCSMESIENAVKGTPFQYSTWEEYKDNDMVKFFNLAAKYPCVEYLTKLGFSDLVKAKLYGWKTYSTVNWNGKTINKVLRVTKQDVKELLSNSLEIDAYRLKIFQLGKKDGSNLTFKEAMAFERNYSFDLSDLNSILKYTTVRRVYQYINKQYEKDNRKHYLSKGTIIKDWRDYIQDCITLGLDVNSENVLFPSKLYNAHQNTIKQIKIKANKLLDQKIKKRLKQLSKYEFEWKGLIIRPATSSQELIDEGKFLNHCVGTYADRYAEGKTNIFVIRKVNDVDKPFFTLEMNNGIILQNRGKKNCAPTEEVSKFVEIFKKQKLEKKSRVKKKENVA